MKEFYHKVDRRSRKAMTEFLGEHFRYNTMNSWNNSTSYANNLKIYNLGLTHEQENKLFDLMECEDAYDRINDMVFEFGSRHGFEWQAGFNGRSGGYLVLYMGGQKESEHKSYCTVCGQRNFRTVEETGCRCGCCGRETRRNFSTPPKEVFTYPGKSVDMYEDFEDWSIEMLRERVQLVEEFDRLCDDIVAEAAYMADNYVAEEQEIMVPVTYRVLTEVVV